VLRSTWATPPRFARLLAALPVDLAALGVVALFFRISGYVIAISIDRYRRRGFLVGRCMRVFPTYAAGYLVTCAVVWAMSDPKHELVPMRVLAGAIPG
jgi:peptidoglycan/LPS O-acetylase OafA/YrhL